MSTICTPVDCTPCEIPQLARNTFFDGKPMSAQDFADEQNYFLGKERRHNQYLHGWGVTCGLVVGEHPNPACRPQYVTVTPGAAIDCCGREILVRTTQMVDIQDAYLAAWQLTHGPKSKPDDQPHRVDLVIRYRECPADPVPAVFEGCGSDPSACLPGKLVDGYEFDVLIDRPPSGLGGGAQRIDWDCTNNIDHVQRLATSPDGKALYALTGVSPGLLAKLDTATHSIQASAGFTGFSGVDVAVAADGAHVFVVVAPDGGGDPELRVLTAADITAAPLHIVPLVGAAAGKVRLLALPDGRLAAASPANNTVWVWAADITGAAAPAAATAIAVANTPMAVAQGPLTTWFYVASSAAAEVTAIRLTDLSTQLLPVGSGGTARPSALAVGVHNGRDLLVFTDSSDDSLWLAEAVPDAGLPSDRINTVGVSATGFAGKAVAVAVVAGSHWAYLLETKADGTSALQAVSIDRRSSGTEPSIGTVVAAPVGAAAILALPSGALFIGFDGSPVAAVPRQPGGIASYAVADSDCLGIFDRLLGPCPACEEGDELVLAAITDYHWQAPVIAAIIDNSVRRLLPSTTILAEVIKCIAESCCGGGAGKEGPQGPQGLPGTNGTNGTNGINGTNGTNGSNGTNGAPGQDAPGLPTDLPRIVGINWPHNGILQEGSPEWKRLAETGLVIAFEQATPVLVKTLDTQTCQLLVESVPNISDKRPEFRLDLTVWCNVLVEVSGVDVKTKCGDQRFKIPDKSAPGPGTTGVRLRALGRAGGVTELPPGNYRVVLEGDHILGEQQIEIEDVQNPGTMIKVNPALDGNHFAPGVGAGRCPTGDRIEGGRFLSWFTVERRG